MQSYSSDNMKTKTYDLVFDLLTRYPPLRDSDKQLIWNVWGKRGYLVIENGTTLIHKESFLVATSPESIRRCRQKIQEKHPELRSSKAVQEEKDKIAAQKGTHIYREEDDENTN